MNPRYSLVVPVFNEEGNIEPLLQTALEVLKTLPGENEIIVVNDGSRDATADEIAAVARLMPSVRSINIPENRGQAAALLTGLQSARGDLILTMDGDGQNDPRDFPVLLGPVEAGQLDVACGWRVNRHDSQLRRMMSKLGNFVRRVVLKDRLHDSGCQLRVMRREVVSVLFPMDLMQSFVPAIAAAAGFRVGEFPVRHHPRTRGEAHFGLRQLWWRPLAALLKVRRHIRR